MAGETQEGDRYRLISLEEIDALLLPAGFRQMKVKGCKQFIYGKVFTIDNEKVSCRLYTGLIGKRYHRNDMYFALFWKPRPEWEPRLVGHPQWLYRTEHWEEAVQTVIETLQAGLTYIEHPNNEINPFTAFWCRCPIRGCNWPLYYNSSYYSKRRRRREGRVHPFWSCSRYPRCRFRCRSGDLRVVDGKVVVDGT